jgi:deoxyribonuclease NucA/NucB
VSDASPDPAHPGEQYAQAGPPKWWMPYRQPLFDGGRSAGSPGRPVDSTGRGAGIGSGEQSGDGIARTIEISPDRFGQAAEHIRDAINAGHPDVLTIDRAGADANRAAATGRLEKVPGMHLDEYPPAMFKEGGAGASVRAINPKDNSGAGGYIGFCCKGLPDGAKIKIQVGEPK